MTMDLFLTTVLAAVALFYGAAVSTSSDISDNMADMSSGQLSLIRDMLESYDRKAKPTWDNEQPINVTFSMDLYQILELNEPQQYILLNAWIIERWYDEFLYWNPLDYSNITELRLPYDVIWLPDTTLYNSLVMKDDDTRRLLNAKLTTNSSRRAVLIDLLYPAIFKFSCLLTLRYFPYDLQVCAMTFSSWTYDQKGIDYLPYADRIGTSNFLENEGWYLLQTSVKRKEVKYSCCPNNYTLLKLTLYLRRKPLFYLINLIIPTSIITLIAIVGFFTTSSASGMREEKVSLGITTLLSMSILMLMVSDQMPTTSTFIPLIGWFILSMIILISLGTLASTVVIAVQKRGRLGERLSRRAIRLTRLFGCLSLTDVPLHLRDEARDRRAATAAAAATTEANVSLIENTTEANLAAKDVARNGSRRVRPPDERFLFGSSTNLSPVESRLARLLGQLRSWPRRRRRTAADRIAPDKSTDLLVAESANSDGTALDDVFRFSPTPKVFQKRAIAHKLMRRDGSLATATPPNTGHICRNEEISGISALLASSMFASSAMAAPPQIERLALRGLFNDENDDDEDEEDEEITSNLGTPAAIAGRPTRPMHAAAASARSGALTPAQLAQQARNFNEGQRRGRQLAQKEYEWVATVLERCCFLVFVIVFFVLTLGINFIGYSHWSDVERALSRDGDERHT